MVRIDMSEYMESHSVARLIGAPPGYVGHDAGGQLTEAVRQNPYTVCLFDEVEKAHPEVLNVLLQVLDEGHLTDGKGRVVDFQNTVIIMTSNVGSRDLLKATVTLDGDIDEVTRDKVMEQVRARFKPELLNRLDEVVLFKPLVTSDLRKICRNMVKLIDERLADRNISLVVTDAACDLILEESYDPAYGARPVRRYIEKKLVTALSRMLLAGELSNDSICTVDAKRGAFDFTCSENSAKRAKLDGDDGDDGDVTMEAA